MKPLKPNQYLPLPVQVTITRPMGGADGTVIALTVTDAESNVRVCEVEMDLASFMLALTGQSGMEGRYRPMTGERAALCGLRMEATEARVTLPPVDFEDKAAVRAAIAKGVAETLEAPKYRGLGWHWSGQESDFRNHHRTKRLPNGGTVTLTVFRRYVAKDGTAVLPKVGG